MEKPTESGVIATSMLLLLKGGPICPRALQFWLVGALAHFGQAARKAAVLPGVDVSKCG